MLEEMSNKAFLRLLVLVITLIVSIGLLWSAWPLLSTADRYIGAALLAIIIGTSVYFMVHAVLNILAHYEEVATRRLQRRIEAETHAHKLRLEAETHALQSHLALTRLAPSEHGYHAVIERSTDGYQIVQVPYSGRSNYAQIGQGKGTMDADTLSLARGGVRIVEMPTQDYLLSQLRHNRLEIIPGIDTKTGECQILSIADSVHFKLIGSSGFGKSCLAASLLDQATKTNDPSRLQIALLDLEHKTSRLFEDVPHIAESRIGARRIPLVATNADEVAQHLTLLVAMLNQRAKLSEYDLQQLPIMLIYVEEMLSLQYEVDPKLLNQMLADLSILALRARKYNMFLLACAQTDYSTPELKTAQKQFRSRIAFAIDTTAARAAGFMSTELIKENFVTAQKGDGRFVMETPGYSGVMVAPQFDVRAMLLELSQPVSQPTQERFTAPDLRIVESVRSDDEEDVKNDEAARQAKRNEIARLRDLGWGKVKIIEKVYGVKSGGTTAYKQASQEYDAIISELEQQKAEA